MHDLMNVRKKGWVKAWFYINGQIAAVNPNFVILAITVIFLEDSNVSPLLWFTLSGFSVYFSSPAAIFGVLDAF